MAGAQTLMLMPTRTVRVPMLNFFLRRFPHLSHLGPDSDFLARQGMVGVYGDCVIGDFRDRNHVTAIRGFGGEAHANFQILDLLKGAAGDFGGQFLVVVAVSLVGFKLYLDFGAGFFALKGRFDAGDNLTMSVQVNPGLLRRGGFMDIAFCVH